MADVAAAGGVAEYVLGLARALARRGHDVRIALPRYRFAVQGHKLESVFRDLPVHTGRPHTTDVDSFELQGSDGSPLKILLLGQHAHFERVTKSGLIYDWADPGPWIAFSRAVIDYLAAVQGDWIPDVIHCQDAHAALIPVYISRFRLGGGPSFATHARTVLTVHNLLDRGQGRYDMVGEAGLDYSLFGPLFDY